LIRHIENRITNRTTVKIKKLFELLRGELFTPAFTTQAACAQAGGCLAYFGAVNVLASPIRLSQTIQHDVDSDVRLWSLCCSQIGCPNVSPIYTRDIKIGRGGITM
jgi:hypothetical protein